MAEKSSFPQIPATVWWGVRAILQRSPKASIDETFLGIELGVQSAAARQYVKELQKVGLIDESGKATEIAEKWRLNETYEESVRLLIHNAYPTNLVEIAPPENPDRDKVYAWFERQGLGSGSARNKGATYLLVASPEPSETVGKPSPKRKAKPTASEESKSTNDKPTAKPKNEVKPTDYMPVNLNLQIHISADATSEQIETIFSAMKKYLKDG